MKKLLQLFAFLVLLPALASAQTCPTLYSRNNGNNSPANCPGAGGTTPEVPTATGTVYSYSSCCSSLTKTGAFFLKWTNSVSPSYVPVIKDCYIDGAPATTIFGPPSYFDSVTNSGKKAINFCFYTVNLPNASKFAINFVNPVNNAAYATCNYTWSGSGDIAPNPAPTITTQPTGATKCVGVSYTFSVAATTSPTTNVLTYQWKKNGTSVPGARGITYTISSVALTDSGYYTCTVFDSTAVTYTTTNAVELTVLASPTLTGASNNGPICSGNTLNLSANGASGVTTYAWSGPVSITNSATASASVPGVTGTASGIYSVAVSNGTCSQTYTTSATVNTIPASVSATASPNPVCATSTLTLTGAATGATSWSWSGPNSFSSAVQSPTLTATAAAAGSYTLSAINSCGTTTVTTTAVTVNAKPTSVSASASPNPVCATATLTFTGAATGASSWSWSGPNSFSSAVQSPTLTATAAAAGTYTLSAINSCGTTTATTTAVTVNATPTSVSASASPNPLCSGNTLTFTGAGTNATSWSWSGPNSFSSAVQSPTLTATAAAAGSYTLSAVNSCGTTTATTTAVTVNTTPTSASASASPNPVCATATLTFTGAATGATSWSWSGPNSFSSAVQSPTLTATAAAAGTYTLSAINSCGTTTATTTAVTVNTKPTSVSASASPNPVCATSTLTFTGSATGATSWSWSGPNSFSSAVQSPPLTATAAAAGTYTLSAINSCGTATATTTAVTVNTTPTSVSASAAPNPLCLNATLTLTGGATGGTSWSWSGPNSFSSAVQSPTLTAIAAAAGAYTLSAINSCGTTTATTTAVTVNTTPGSVTASASPNPVCVNSTLTLTGSATGATSWSWSGPNSFSSAVQSPTLTATAAAAGTYTLSAVNSCGTVIATTSAVTVNDKPTSVSASASPNPVCATSTLTFTGSATGATSWLWSGPNSFSSAVQSPTLTATAAAAGSYTLSAINSCGTTTVTTTAVTVNTTPTSVSASASPNPVCATATLTFTGAATGGTSWSWSGPNSFSSAVQSPTLTATAAAAGTYTLSAINSCGTTTATTTAVTVNTTPTSVSASASPNPVCATATLTFTGAATGAASWSWSGPNSFGSAAQSPTLTATAAAAGSYTLSAINSCGTTTATTTAVTVNVTPDLSGYSQPSTTTACLHSDVPVSISASGLGSATYTVTYNVGGGLPGATGATATMVTSGGVGTFTVPNTYMSTFSTYTITVTSIAYAAGCSSPLSSGNKTGVTLNALPNPNGYNPTASSVCLGSSSSATITSSFLTGAVTVTYDLSGTNGSTGNTASFTMSGTAGSFSIPSGLLSSAGSTTMTITQAAYSTGCSSAVTSSNTATFNVNANPGVSNFSASAADVCAGGGTTVTLSSTTLAAGTYTVTYSVSGANTVNATTATVTMASNSGSFTIGSGALANTGANTVTISSIKNASNCSATLSSGNTAGFNVKVLPNAGTISGAVSINIGSTVTLSTTGSGGNWISGSTSVATVNSTSGVVTGAGNGTAIISYSTSNSCGTDVATVVVTVNTLSAITGPTSVIIGNIITLADLTSGGTWSTSNTSLATIGTNGVVTAGTSTGVVTITYTVGGAYVTYDVTINPIQAITGTATVLVGNSTTLADATAGGTWSTSSSLATVGSTGVVTAGTSTGVATITYTVGGAYVTYDVTINPIQAITGTATVLVGNTTNLSDATLGGTWSTSSSLATVGSTGVVTAGTSTGVVTITYTLGGAYVTYDVTVNAIQPITGTATVLVGNSTNLSDATPGGTWSTSSSLATVGSTGVVTAGTSTGVVTITYTLGGAYVTYDVTINPIQAITGTATVLVGNSTTLADAAAGGTWSTSSSLATVGSTGVVTAGTSTGVVTITYTLGGAYVTYDVTVNAIQPITGTATVLVGNSTNLSDATPGGTWSTSSSLATVASTGVVTAGTSTGVVTITYTLGGAYVTYDVTINPIQAITGTATVLVGNTTNLSDATPGGTWSTSSSLATVGSTGVVTAGTSTGVATITYTVGGAYVTYDVTINPIQAITGTATVLVGNTTNLSDATLGGTWSTGSSLATVGSTGVVTAGTSTGMATITYTVGGAYVTYEVTINPIQAITGTATVLVGNSTNLSDATAGGTWSTSSSLATVGSTGVVTAGTSTGVATITYTVGGAYVTYDVTINPIQAITGTATVLVGNTTNLSDATPGGTWSTSSSLATVGSTGVVTAGTSTGVATITYTVGGAYVTYDVTINPIQAITGTATVLVGNTTNLSDATLGGTWSTSSSLATVGSTGVVTAGTSTGVATITYTVGGAYVTYDVTINPIQAITGTATVLVGNTTNLSDATLGGTWSTGSSLATVGSTGVVTAGTSTGMATITYTVGGAYVTYEVTINPIQAITGTATVLVGNSTNLSDATAGGTWSTSSSLATVGSTGVVTAGTSTGVATITYTVGGAYVTYDVTINPIQAITGTATVLVGNSTTLADAAAGGTWSTSSSLATVGSTGVVTAGTSTGVVTITYTLGGAYVTYDVTVNAIQPITGTATVLVGNSTNLSDATPGGTWSTSSSLATVASTGVVTAGTSTGVVTITYTLGGAYVTYDVTINPIQAITGTATVLVGNTTNLSDATPGGTWSTSSSLATVGSTGVVTAGTSTGVATITYTVGGAYVTYDVTINAIQPITGAATALVGNTTSLADATAGGTWSTSSSLATVGSTGVVTAGTSTGVVTITYTLGGAYVTYDVTVNAIQPITGTATVLVGNSTNLSDATAGGTWSTSSSLATVGSTGVVTAGTSTGVATITYTVGGAYVTYDVTINPIQAITGTDSVLADAAITLADVTPGGTWSISDNTIASIGSDGTVIGMAPGTVTVTYTIGGGYVTRTITVKLLQPITGSGDVCLGSTITMTDATPGGTWNSSTPGVATIATGGVVSSQAAGVTLISYTVAGVTVTKSVTVNTVSAIAGTTNACVGSSATLTNETSSGTWGSSNTAKATVDVNSGVLTGVASGLVNISYTSAHGCVVTTVFTINALPSVAAISGTASVCIGLTTSLGNTTANGVWDNSNTTAASVDANGVVSGLAAGNTTISYTVTNVNGCVTTVTKTITVNALPAVTAITGSSTVCAGLTATLSDATTGGTWSSSDATTATVTSSGVVAGINAGTATITYIVTNGAGCVSYTIAAVTVTSIPAITGVGLTCTGTTTTLANIADGGTWSSSNTSVATIGSATGILSPLTTGNATITYRTLSGCYASAAVSVNQSPANISGGGNVCLGSSATLTSATGGGTWSTSDATVAPVNVVGIAAGSAPGIATITYTMYNGCFATANVSVNAYPSAIAGAATMCSGNTITLTDAMSGGTWSSFDTSLATVDTFSGVVTARALGMAMITYTSDRRCSVTVTVNNPMNYLAGGNTLCVGSSQYVTTLTSGGTWSSSNPAVASINAGGWMTAIATGNATITYKLPTGCFRTLSASVVTGPAPIAGVAVVCQGQTITLSNPTTGGLWKGQQLSPAILGPSNNGSILGLAAGTTVVSYLLNPTCYVLTTVTTNPNPSIIIGSSFVCPGATTTLTSGTPGFVWSTSDASTALIDASTGVITGVATGPLTITYTNPTTGCYTTRSESVNPVPGNFTGNMYTCVGKTTQLSSISSLGYTWTSGNTSVATVVGSTGLVSGVSGGSAVISYTNGVGCTTTGVVTVTALPAALTGNNAICLGGTTVFSSTDMGGSWTSSNTAIASVDPVTGVISGVGAGSATITYSYSSIGCITTKNVTVNPLPAAITGSLSVCIGGVTTLNDVNGGGTWTSSDATITVNSYARAMIGVATGTATITYTLPTGCTTTTVLTVIPTPTAITGNALISQGSSTTLANSLSGGTWTSGYTYVAMVDPVSGVVTSVAAGSTTITYTLANGCSTTRVVTVSAINPIAGTTTLCSGGSATLTCSTTGGSWSSTDITVATINPATGVLTGVGTGTSTITYMLASGLFRTAVVTVNAAVTGITGNTPICVGNTLTLANTTSGGTWTSSNTSVAVVGSSSGVVTGAGNGGSATITYNAGVGCVATTILSVNSNPPAISGATSVCLNQSGTLGDAVSGGTWSSSTPAIAAIDPTSGIVTPAAVGTTTITYAVPSGCYTKTTYTIKDIPNGIMGVGEICVGGVTSLTNSTPGGVWSDTHPSGSTQGPSTTGVISGLAAGTSIITYSLANGCSTMRVVTVDPLPTYIYGASQVCPGVTTTLADSTTGGVWSIDPAYAGTASINASGVVTGIATGTAMITYTNGLGCSITKVFSVTPTPAPITGSLFVCPGGSSVLSNASANPVGWQSSTPSVATISSTSGYVTAVASGTTTITFSTGYGCTTTAVFTVNATPPAITGNLKACIGYPATLASVATGGVWSSNNTSIATVDPSSGVVTGLSASAVAITYSAGAGCYRVAVVTVGANPNTPTGYQTPCVGTLATFSTSSSNGLWSTSSTSIATVGSTTGYVTGIAPGTVVLSYTLSSGCYATTTLTVIPTPAAITGTLAVCAGSTQSLTNTSPNGTWSCSNVAVATIGSTGTLTGVGQGTAVISYNFGANCRTTAVITSNALPAVLGGTASVCSGSATTLSEVNTGGTWSSSNTSVATVGTGTSAGYGAVTGIAAGTALISYKFTATGCARTAIVTVNAAPNAGVISGVSTYSVTSAPTATLTSSGDAGGTWSSSNSAIATIGSASGTVSAVAPGNATITYTVTLGGCSAKATKAITVSAGRSGGNNSATTADASVELALYPNPTNGAYTLSVSEVGTFSIFTVDGKSVGQYDVQVGVNPMTMPQGMAAGVYMCRFTSASGSTVVVRLVYEQ
jgi:uncharacterized protein YjdB